MACTPKPERKKHVGWRLRRTPKPAVGMTTRDRMRLDRRDQQSAKNLRSDWAETTRNSLMKRKRVGS